MAQPAVVTLAENAASLGGIRQLVRGSRDELLDSLARVCLPLPDETVVLSGHGPQTTIGRERATNPFLTEAAPLVVKPRGM